MQSVEVFGPGLSDPKCELTRLASVPTVDGTPLSCDTERPNSARAGTADDVAAEAHECLRTRLTCEHD